MDSVEIPSIPDQTGRACKGGGIGILRYWSIVCKLDYSTTTESINGWQRRGNDLDKHHVSQMGMVRWNRGIIIYIHVYIYIYMYIYNL